MFRDKCKSDYKAWLLNARLSPSDGLAELRNVSELVVALWKNNSFVIEKNFLFIASVMVGYHS